MALLVERGHQIAFCSEVDAPAERPPISLPPGTATFRVIAGQPASVDVVRAWGPEVIYAQGFLDAGVEEEIASVAPTVFFAHSYYGTCISGDKTHKFPWVQPCDRVFGAACLAYYFPRRCGGRSPLTMVREYDRQRRRLALLRRCAAVLTHSEHMRREFARHGAAGGRVYNISYSVTGAEAAMPPSRLRQRDAAPAAWRVMFIGRMNRLKGGRYLLDALPAVQRQVDRPLHVTFAGDGPARHDWEKRARQIRGRHATVSIEFAGWLQHDQLALRLDTTDLVVVPSLWPEPFGLVGPEANRRGIPVVAYATGGIPDWLHDGVNGCLAPGNPPTVAGLVEAMVRCLRSVETSDALRRGALEMGHARADDVHVDGLLEILGGAAAGTGPTRA